MSRVSILPIDALQTFTTASGSDDHSLPFIRLPHPRTNISSVFLQSRTSMGSPTLLEVQTTEPPNPRSWFIDEAVVSDGRLLLVAPIDPAFVLLPILRIVSPEGGSTGLFRPVDDIFEDAITKLTQSGSTLLDPASLICAADVLAFVGMDCTKQALSRVCEVKEVSEDLTVYRYSQDKVIQLLRRKVDALLFSKEFETNTTIIRNLAKNGLMDDGQEDLLKDGRIQAACDLIGHYVPQDLKAALIASYDLSALHKHIRIMQESTPLASAVTSKEPIDKDNTTKPSKRKAKTSHGVGQLKKANTKGMAKISSFFGKT